MFINASGAEAIALDGGSATVTTSGANANAVELTSTVGPVSVTIGDISTSGSLAGGVRAIGGLDGDVTVTTGNVTTTGIDGSSFFFLPNSTGITATAAGTGNVSVTSGSINTAGLGARGVNASAIAGDVTVTTGPVTTTGGDAIAVAANSDTGNVSVTTTGAVNATGDGAQGIYAIARNGSAAVSATTVATSGFNAAGIQAISGEGGSTIDFDEVSTSGTFSTGVIAGSTGGDVNVTGADVTATGAVSSAIYGYSDTGAVNVTTTGDVVSTGRGGFGIYATSATGDVAVSANNVSTVAADAADTATSRSAIYAQGANASVVVTGTAAMAGQALYGGPADAVTVIATNGDASADVNNVTSTGTDSDAVNVSATGGMAMINVDGAVATTGDDSFGLYARGDQGVIVTGAGSVTTSGANANAVDALSTTGPISVTIGDISTSGSLAGGVRAIGGLDGDVTVATGNVTTTGLDGGSFFFLPNSTAITATAAGTGNVSVTSGSISTAGLGARGVNASAAAGDVIVTTGPVTTTGSNAIAVAANSDTGNVSVTTTGAVNTNGDGAQGIYATARNGSAAVSATTVATSGFNAASIQAISGAGGSTVDFDEVSTSGTFSTGVIAGSTGGDVNITGGDVTATGAISSAIYGYSDTGAVNVTTTGDVASTGRGGFGIYATSATGDVAVSANNVSTVAADAADTATSRSAIYAQGANASVVVTGTAAMAGQALYGGPADAVVVIATGGDASADVRNVTSTGATSRAVNVTATGDASATVRGAVSTTGTGADAVFVSAGDRANVNVTANGTIASVNGNLITGNSVNGATINNAGVLGGAQKGYTIAVTGGPATINNSGTLRSDIMLTAGNDVVNNSGRFVLAENPDFGAGTDVFNNTGTVALSTGRTTAGTVTLTGLEQVNNSGLVDLRNGVIGDRLVVPGAFTGTGASQLGLDANLGTGASDRLVLGAGATGSTTILLRQTGTEALFNPGTIVVQAGAASSANAFNLGGAGGGMDAGLVRYDVVYNSTDFSYSLVGGPSDAAFRTLNYVEGVRSLWLKSADVVSAQLQARRDQLWAEGEGETTGKIWVQMHGSVEDRGNGGNFTAFGATRAVNTGYKQDYFGGQVGLDIGGGSGERGGFAFGVTGGYISSSMQFDGSADRVSFDVVNAGIYGSFTSGNVFINGLAKYDYYWADARSTGGGFRDKSKGDAYGGRVEAGLRFGNDSFFAEPAVSVSYVKSDFDSFASQGVAVDFNDADGLRGRAGARLGTQIDMFGAKASIYAGGNYVHEFKGRDSVTFVSGGQTLTYRNNRVGDYGEAKLGVEIAQVGGVSGFIEGTYIKSFSDNSARRSDIEGAGGRAGLRIRF
ncbi:beta strand repeat-containing protein [Novosphingobium sp. BL-52-GroH]|uniref:beta strand repeat-containing protein n=1 Tax=Novosphingobium sp. BL-52-GroH TaxID=3349877 RepID=UPI00384FEDD2